MYRTFLLLGSGVFWAIMMAALIRREFLPYLEYHTPPSYRSLLRGWEEPTVLKRIVFFGEERIGQTETRIEPRSDGSYRIRSRADLRLSVIPTFRLMGAAARTRSSSEMEIAPGFQLSSFVIKSRVLGFTVRASGRREGRDLVMEYDLGFLRGEERIRDIPEDMTFSDDVFPYMGGGKLREGKKWKIKVLRPEINKKTFRITDAYAEVIARQTLQWKGRPVEVYRVDLKWEPDPMHDRTPVYSMFVDDRGTVLVQERQWMGYFIRFVLDEERTLTPVETEDERWFREP